ncbi:DUF6464 family protein [Stenomitos frigidus]|uniref:DUF6464 family protein n=1 Tax=Stenomitos frigidus TaxID=1886765 RepID=UPI001C62C2A2
MLDKGGIWADHRRQPKLINNPACVYAAMFNQRRCAFSLSGSCLGCQHFQSKYVP